MPVYFIYNNEISDDFLIECVRKNQEDCFKRYFHKHESVNYIFHTSLQVTTNLNIIKHIIENSNVIIDKDVIGIAIEKNLPGIVAYLLSKCKDKVSFPFQKDKDCWLYLLNVIYLIYITI